MALLSEGDAENRLRALSVERDALERRIADHRLYLELGRRLSEDVRDEKIERPARPASSSRDHGRAILAAVADILREEGGALHTRDILARLRSRGLDMPGADPVAALNTRLWKRSRPQDGLRRLGDAVYALREETPPR